MKYRVHIEDDDYMEIFADYGEDGTIVYRGTIYFKYFLQNCSDVVDNTEIVYGISLVNRQRIKNDLLHYGLTLDDDNIVRRATKDIELLLWQNELNKLGYLTRIEDNKLLIIDKLIVNS